MENLETIINTKPTGGFPSLFICKKENLKKKDTDEHKERGFANKEIVSSLKDIMTSRRKSDIKDFISL